VRRSASSGAPAPPGGRSRAAPRRRCRSLFTSCGGVVLAGLPDPLGPAEAGLTGGCRSRLRARRAPVAWVCDAPSRWCCRRGGASERRASGGCLGVERRRRTWHAAKSPGEPRAGFDPGISEWGNPPQRWGTVTRIHSVAGRTRGTETSQYPEERTSTETPSVAASERGPGQWPKAQNRKGMESPPTAGDRPVRVERPSVLE
jgi:hypothetical protein